MKRTIWIIGGVGTVLAAAVIVLPYLIPSSVYRAQVEKQAEAALGRDVTLTGATRLTIVPRLSARIGGVTVANPEGFSAANMIEAGEMRARVKFWPLLSGQVRIADISFVDANVSLERLADGRANWIFGSETESSSPTPESSGGLSTGVDHASLVNSSLTYRDAATGEIYTLTDFNAQASMQALDEPLTFEGDGQFNGQNFDLDLELSSVSAATSGRDAVADLNLITDFGTIAYDGTLRLAELPNINGEFSVKTDQLSALLDVLSLDLGYDLSALGDLSADGTVAGSIDALNVKLERATQTSDFLQSTYSGTINLTSELPLDVNFTLKSRNISGATNALGLDLPVDLAPFGSVDIVGTVKGAFNAPKVQFERLIQTSDLMTTNYVGSVDLQNAFGVAGKLTTSISDAGRLLTQIGMDAGPVEALEKLDFSGEINGPLSALSVKNADLKHRGSLIDLNYTGNLQLGQNGSISGPITTSSNDLRGLLSAMSVELAPGDTLNSFDLSGNLSGAPDNFSVANLEMKVDDVSGTGAAGINLTKPVPRIVADLNMPALDLTPFLGEGSSETAPREQATGWSTEPLALEGLRAVDADIKLNAGLLRIDKVALNDADISASLSNGSLDTVINSVNAFGGNWGGTLALNASGSTPTLAIDMKGSSVAIDSVMSTFANLESLSGVGNLSFNARSSGNSLNGLINGLNGELKTNLSDGEVKGFNIAQIIRSVDSIQSGLASGNLNFGLSPGASTDFTQFDGALTITNGVAQIDVMRALNPAVLLDGSGRINLANQTLDISITPSVDEHGGGDLGQLKLNGEPFAIPFKISGNWLSPSVSIDNGAIGKQLQARALGAVGGKITEELGGDLGGILGDALGVPTNKPNPDNSQDESAPNERDKPDESEPEDAPSEPESLEDAVENAVKDRANDALKDLFGSGD